VKSLITETGTRRARPAPLDLQGGHRALCPAPGGIPQSPVESGVRVASLRVLPATSAHGARDCEVLSSLSVPPLQTHLPSPVLFLARVIGVHPIPTRASASLYLLLDLAELARLLEHRREEGRHPQHSVKAKKTGCLGFASRGSAGETDLPARVLRVCWPQFCS